jgi:F-type H+-transporting ATPase subunit a
MPKVEKRRRWRWGVNRWFVLLFIILGAVAAAYYPPIRPHVQLPAENVLGHPLLTLPVLGSIYLTNTLVATLIGDVVLLILAFAVRQSIRANTLVVGGIGGAIEALVEVLYGMAESAAGKWARKIFPWMMTIVLLVLVANWMELIPGVDSIGSIHHAAEGGESFALQQIGPLATIIEPESGASGGYVLAPWVRVASTDLNFTLSLALISVFMTQIFGIRALGASYFTKFFNTKTMFNKPIFGVIDFAVSLLELVSEISKVLSFTFRLFGNLFAGSVLLFVIGSLVPVFAQSLFLLLEFFIGIIQALVFGLLTMVFMSQAVAGHGEHEAAH